MVHSEDCRDNGGACLLVQGSGKGSKGRGATKEPTTSAKEPTTSAKEPSGQKSAIGPVDPGKVAREAARRALGTTATADRVNSGDAQAAAQVPMLASFPRAATALKLTVRVFVDLLLLEHFWQRGCRGSQPKVREQPAKAAKVRPGFGTWQPRRSAQQQADDTAATTSQPAAETSTADDVRPPRRASDSAAAAAASAAAAAAQAPGRNADATAATEFGATPHLQSAKRHSRKQSGSGGRSGKGSAKAEVAVAEAVLSEQKAATDTSASGNSGKRGKGRGTSRPASASASKTNRSAAPGNSKA